MTAIPRNQIDTSSASGPRLQLVEAINSGHTFVGASVVKTSKPNKEQPLRKRIEGVPGLYLFTYRSGYKGWFQRVCIQEKYTWIRVGVVGKVSFVDAMAEVKRIQDDLALGRDPRGGRISLDGFFEKDYRPHVLAVEKASAPDDFSRYKLYVSPHIGSMPLCDIKARDVQAVIDFWRRGENSTMRRERLKNSTINRIAMLIRAVLRLAVDTGFISSNPAKGLRNLKETPPSPVALDTDGLKKLFEAMLGADLKLALVVEVVLNGALRITEAMQLKYEDIDRKNGFVHLRKTKAGVPQTIPLSSALDSVFRRAEVLRRDDNPYIFPAARGNGPMAAPRKAWNRLLIDAGIDHSGFHLLRKTWATLAVANMGLDVLTCARYLRHQSIRTLEVHYLATPHKRLRQAANVVGGLLSRQRLIPVSPSVGLKLKPSVPTVCVTRHMRYVISGGVSMW